MEVVYIARVHSTLTEDWPSIPKSSLWASSSPSQISSFVTKWYVQFKKCLFIRTPPNMANFYVKNSSRTSIWLKRVLCANYATPIFFIRSKYFVFADDECRVRSSMIPISSGYSYIYQIFENSTLLHVFASKGNILKLWHTEGQTG